MNPIYALWSHPRSMSTAMERVMRERGDLDCAHEPFMYDYYVARRIRVMPHFTAQAGHPVSYSAIRDQLLARAKARPVFIKDMSYYVMPHILSDDVFVSLLVNCFLIRDPLAAIVSYFKLDPDVTLDEIGLEAQWLQYKALAERGPAPSVITAEDIRRDPRAAMAALWARLGLPYSEVAFDWQKQKPKDWEQVSGWHADVMASTSIRPISADETVVLQAQFDEMAAAQPRMKDYLAYHRPFYERLRSVALTV